MNLGPEMLFLLILAFLLFGPKRLPEMGRKLGRALAEFKRASNELRGQLENEMRQLEAEEREKKISPPVPANTVAALPETASAPAAVSASAPSAGVAADSDPHPSPGPGVEGA